MKWENGKSISSIDTDSANKEHGAKTTESVAQWSWRSALVIKCPGFEPGLFTKHDACLFMVVE